MYLACADDSGNTGLPGSRTYTLGRPFVDVDHARTRHADKKTVAWLGLLTWVELGEADPERSRIELFDMGWWMYFSPRRGGDNPPAPAI